MNLNIYFHSYKNLLNIFENELTYMNNIVDEFNKEPLSTDIDLSKRISELKRNINLDDIEEEPINLSTSDKLYNSIFSYKNHLDKLIDDFSKLKDKIAYGGNIFRAILNKPKVYHYEDNEEAYHKINNNIRSINYMIDWIEKGILDLSSYVNQDLNVLNLVNRVYRKSKIYESECIEKVLSEL